MPTDVEPRVLAGTRFRCLGEFHMYVSMAPTLIAATAILGFEISRPTTPQTASLATTGLAALPTSLIALLIIAVGLTLVAFAALASASMIELVIVAATMSIVAYTVTMYLQGRSSEQPMPTSAEDIRFVFMVPCLNEELVLHRTIDRLLALETDHRFAVMVIDDGSTDGTSDVARSYDPERVWLFRREHPDAQNGKGEALNAAYRQLRDTVVAAGQSPDAVIVAVMDADGRLDRDALDHVAPFFDEPMCASVQIKVRIHNAPDSLVARLQDMEFTSYTEVFQRGRSRLGSAGLGGNGQFARLSALMWLGDRPWSDCLTEDLELGIQFLLNGWTNRYCHTTSVSQQGITTLGPLLRQRTRWFQGHLQCIRFVVPILKSGVRPWSRFDLTFHLLNPLLMLLLQTASMLWLGRLVWELATQPLAETIVLFSGERGLALYLLAFGLAPLIGFVYLRTEPDVRPLTGMAVAHVYILYSYLWYFAGVRATVRHLTGRRGWTKTARTIGTGDEIRVRPSLATVRRATRRASLRSRQAQLPSIDLCSLDGEVIGPLIVNEDHALAYASFTGDEVFIDLTDDATSGPVPDLANPPINTADPDDVDREFARIVASSLTEIDS